VTGELTPRTARNLEIAKRFYDGYHRSVERGHLEKVFDPVDLADGWVFASPYLGGEGPPPMNDLAAGADANHQSIWQLIPDYKMDDFAAWPTDDGCAWRWRVNGHDLDGRHHEFWEQLFIRTNDDGRIVRFEFFDDWHGFPQTLHVAYGSSLDDLSGIEGYGAAPWRPAPPIDLHALPEAPVPPSARRGSEIARRLFEAYGNGFVDGTLTDEFADAWTFFSPWSGELDVPAGAEFVVWARTALERMRERVPDWNVADLAAWPTIDGCACRWRVGGGGADGVRREYWEQVFVRTNPAGQITRLEVFDDWLGFPQALGYATRSSVAELWDASAMVSRLGLG
jgi:hypothetical protein